MGRKVQTLTDELQALREERQNVIFDTGSDSDDAPVRKTGPKRKAASPRVSRAAKRARPTHGYDSDSSDDAPAPTRRKLNHSNSVSPRPAPYTLMTTMASLRP
jgi:hypothetical protein